MKERSRGRCCLPDTQRRAAAARAEPTDLKLITRIPAEVYSYCRDNKAQRISRHPSTPPVSLRTSRHDKHHQLNQRRRTETALARCTLDKRGASAAAPRVPRRGERDAGRRLCQKRETHPHSSLPLCASESRAGCVSVLTAAGSAAHLSERGRSAPTLGKIPADAHRRKRGESRAHYFAFTRGTLRRNDTE